MRFDKAVFVLYFLLFFLCFGDSIVFAKCSDCGDEGWEPSSAGTLTTWTAPVCGKGGAVVQPYFFYNRARGTFNAEGGYDSLPSGDRKYQYVEQIFMQYGLTERLEIDAQIAHQHNYIKQSGVSAHYSGLADSFLFLRGCLLEEAGILPYLTGLLQVKLPTGKYQKADSNKLGTDITGAGAYEYGAGLIMTKKLKPFVFHLDAIYNFPVETKIDGTKTEYADYLNFDLGVEYFFGKGFNLMFEVNGVLQGDKKENGSLLPASDVKSIVVSPGIGWSGETIQTLLAYQRVVAGSNTDANDSVVFTFVYSF